MGGRLLSVTILELNSVRRQVAFGGSFRWATAIPGSGFDFLAAILGFNRLRLETKNSGWHYSIWHSAQQQSGWQFDSPREAARLSVNSTALPRNLSPPFSSFKATYPAAAPPKVSTPPTSSS
nr:hypothetical protein Iba_chr06aCG15270 [Ipomoea batatas]